MTPAVLMRVAYTRHDPPPCSLRTATALVSCPGVDGQRQWSFYRKENPTPPFTKFCVGPRAYPR